MDVRDRTLDVPPDVVAAIRALSVAAWGPLDLAGHAGKGTPLRRYLTDLGTLLTTALGNADASLIDSLTRDLSKSELTLMDALGPEKE